MGVGQGVGRLHPEPGDAAEVVRRPARSGSRTAPTAGPAGRGTGTIGAAANTPVRSPSARLAVRSAAGASVGFAPARSRRSSSQHLVEPLPLDELHGVVVDPVGRPDVEHRDDVRVVQPGGAAGLAAEPEQPERVAAGLGREHLQGDVPAEGHLLGLVHHPHPAAGHLPQDAVVAELLGRAVRAGGRGGAARSRPA